MACISAQAKLCSDGKYLTKRQKISPWGRKPTHKTTGKVLPAAAIGLFSLWLMGCGTGPGTGGSSSQTNLSEKTVTITIQPSSQIVPIDRPAKFSVTAVGALPLKYQWYRDGSAISGATSATYTLSNVTSGDSGSSFKVTVGNAFGSVTSQTGVLTAGPRAPKLGDLRYLLWQQVDAPDLGNNGGVATDVGTANVTATGAVGGPLEMGPASSLCGATGPCAWQVSYMYLPPGQTTELGMGYASGRFTDLNTNLHSIIAPNTVIDSLALEPQVNQYAISWTSSTQASGFDYRLQVVPPADLQSTAALDGSNGRVVTAVSFDGPNQVYLISYGWQGDQTTYDVRTTTVTAANLVAAAKKLAADGYIISAFGGDDTTGWILIGMHAMGYSQPRSLFVNSISAATLPPDTAYFTAVALLEDPNNQPVDLDISEQ